MEVRLWDGSEFGQKVVRLLLAWSSILGGDVMDGLWFHGSVWRGGHGYGSILGWVFRKVGQRGGGVRLEVAISA